MSCTGYKESPESRGKIHGQGQGQGYGHGQGGGDRGASSVIPARQFCPGFPGTPLTALVDCNNFYVSCERLFDPRLRGRPVVVLSGNEGCIIARSNEAKAVGIPMGAPLFQCAELIKRHQVICRASNFALYGDLSARVMQVLFQTHGDLEVYSIDEAFLDLEKMEAPLKYLGHLREKILQWTGIPVSIGVASSKTLAKVAAKLAKKSVRGVEGILSEGEREKILLNYPVGEVWGIGRRLTEFLLGKNIRTAWALQAKEEQWLKKHLGVNGLRTALELRGVACHECAPDTTAKKSLMTSRSFTLPLQDKAQLLQAVAHFAARGGEKLRQEGSLASALDVFIMTSPHKEGFYSNNAHRTFPVPTAYTPHLIASAKEGVEAIFRDKLPYKKAGVLLSGLVPRDAYQLDLFTPRNAAQEKKHADLMALVDQANDKFGYDILHWAATTSKAEPARPTNLSPRYTTRWDEILQIK